MLVLTIDKNLNLFINGMNINLIIYIFLNDKYFKDFFWVLIYFLNVDKIYLQSHKKILFYLLWKNVKDCPNWLPIIVC
jgi:hypothetical protein